MKQKITCQAPSNIALVKYWGKYGVQMPLNPSISFTLSESKTITSIELKEKTLPQLDVEFYFEGKRNQKFEEKILKFIKLIEDDVHFVKSNKLVIHSENTFPHSSGIASSASSMAALAYGLCALEGTEQDLKRVSNIARLGSGSACRSVYPHLAIWGKNKFISGSADTYAIAASSEVDEVFHDYQNSILIADAGEKSVSSRVGHELMNSNPFGKSRIDQANGNMIEILGALKDGDIESFGAIVEEEALTLHAMMMTSRPNFILMNPNSLTMMIKIRAYRADTGKQVYFTLDAGPNIHLLYPVDIKQEVRAFIDAELKPHCDQGKIIHDFVGHGPSIF
jgi:diphosphomevalonate decarboxylase